MPEMEVCNFETENGRDVIADFLDDLSAREAAKCIAGIDWLRTGEIELHPKAREHLDGDIWELKVRCDGEQFRFLYASDKGTAFLLVPIHKKQRKAPRKAIDLAKKRLGEVRKRGART